MIVFNAVPSSGKSGTARCLQAVPPDARLTAAGFSLDRINQRSGPAERVPISGRGSACNLDRSELGAGMPQRRARTAFSNERGLTVVRPEQLASATDTVELLLSSPFYEAARPVALYTWTDVMALPASRTHLVELLEQLIQR